MFMSVEERCGLRDGCVPSRVVIVVMRRLCARVCVMGLAVVWDLLERLVVVGHVLVGLALVGRVLEFGACAGWALAGWALGGWALGGWAFGGWALRCWSSSCWALLDWASTRCATAPLS